MSRSARPQVVILQETPEHPEALAEGAAGAEEGRTP